MDQNNDEINIPNYKNADVQPQRERRRRKRNSMPVESAAFVHDQTGLSTQEFSEQHVTPQSSTIQGDPVLAMQRRRRRRNHDESHHSEHRHHKRLPRSVSEEVMALEGNFPQQTQSFQPTDEMDRVNGSQSRLPSNRSSTTSKAKIQKKRRKVRSEIVTSGDEENYQGDAEVSEIFRIDKEDILPNIDFKYNGQRQHEDSVIGTHIQPSQPLDILFVEKQSGFTKEDRATAQLRLEQSPSPEVERPSRNDHEHYNSMVLAQRFHRIFRSLAEICHGLLAGVAATTTIFAYSLSSSSDFIFLTHYSSLSNAFQSIFYFLLAITSVSILDRYMSTNAGDWNLVFYKLFSKPWRALILAVHWLALVFSVSLARLDDRISLHQSQSLWDDTGKLTTWRILNLIRLICVVLSWCVISCTPKDDDEMQAGILATISIQKQERQLSIERRPDVTMATTHRRIQQGNSVV